MPRESTPLIRKSGFLEAEKFYILAYEGDVTEKKYFEDLRQSSMFNNSGSIETIPLKKRVRVAIVLWMLRSYCPRRRLNTILEPLTSFG